MAGIVPLEIGLVEWTGESASETLKKIEGFGLRAIQLGIPPSIDCAAAEKEWKAALPSSSLVLTSAVCAYAGEDYTDLAAVHETVGFTNAKYRDERLARTQEISNFAAEFGIGALSCHIGFIPADSSDPLYAELIDVARALCDIAAGNKQSFVLETGQESADTLLRFIGDAERSNLKINFDPANMILYGSGDPVEALKALREHVISVHCKDGTSPVSGGTLGSECALGDGEVDFPAFLRTLQEIGYAGPLTIEREEPDAMQRAADIRTAIERLTQWKSELSS